MALVDELTIRIHAGDGGDGVVRWRREKFIPKGGPAGGDGARGGDVFVRGVRDMAILEGYVGLPKLAAENGEPGRGRSQHGKNGEDLYIDLPVGSHLTNLQTKEEFEITEVGQEIKILKGGRGGYGNEHFKSSTNTTPQEWTPGQQGEHADFRIELRLFADLGLVGFPNAGKSSLINELTNAQSKVGAYAFTTLDPHLGAFYEFVIADIPGIIEGASAGKGLGSKFLKHVSRTKVLLHLVSFEHELEEEGGMVRAYQAIRKELQDFGKGLPEKREIILLTKTDMTDEEIVEKQKKAFAQFSDDVFAVSMFDDQQVKQFKDDLVKLLRN